MSAELGATRYNSGAYLACRAFSYTGAVLRHCTCLLRISPRKKAMPRIRTVSSLPLTVISGTCSFCPSAIMVRVGVYESRMSVGEEPYGL
ncbi:hypothetical protein BDU57DRAFT_521765, partial [Ampelomyces quisqualis]